MAAVGLGTFSALVIVLLAAILIPLAASYELKPRPALFVNDCKRKMGLKCGNEVNIRLFGHGMPFSDCCCNKLEEEGRECHDAIIAKHLLGKPDDYIEAVLGKSNWVWEHCLRVIKYKKRHNPKA